MALFFIFMSVGITQSKMIKPAKMIGNTIVSELSTCKNVVVKSNIIISYKITPTAKNVFDNCTKQYNITSCLNTTGINTDCTTITKTVNAKCDKGWQVVNVSTPVYKTKIIEEIGRAHV